LGVSYLNTQIIQEVARRLGMTEVAAAEHDERGEAFIDRLARVLWLAEPSFGLASSPPLQIPFESTSQTFVAVTRQLVQEAARTGNVVIFGHGAQYILAGQPGVLHARFVAPFPTRVERAMRRATISRAEAERRIREEDQRRATYTRQYFGADWHATEPFHLILNTALWDEEACIQLVLQAVDELARHQPAPSSTQRSVDAPSAKRYG